MEQNNIENNIENFTKEVLWKNGCTVREKII